MTERPSDPPAERAQPSGTGPDDTPYYIPAGAGSRHRIFPGVEILTNAGRGIMLSLVTFEPGSIVEDHSHPHEQMGMLISGRLEFVVGGMRKVLGPGDLWRIPGGVVHRVAALDGPAVALDVFHPIREDYL
ncbi:MAG: cupin domain-containing protein [Isosphaeraceae bacterium]